MWDKCMGIGKMTDGEEKKKTAQNGFSVDIYITAYP